MSFAMIEAGAVVTVHDRESLLALYRAHRDYLHLIREFVMDGPLTARQLERLPRPLRERLTLVDASVERLEQLYDLEDPRR
jgi:hypothetical protein